MDLGQKTVLVVDDEKRIIDVVKSYLERSNFKVLTSTDGKTAIDLFTKQHPDLIILDLMLPDITGEEICRTIRKTSRVPIIMLTAKVEEESVLRGLGIGADDYVTKPFSPNQLIARVNAVLRRASDDKDPLMNQASFDGGDLVIDYVKKEIRAHSRPVALTPNEYRILTTIAKHPGRVYSRDEVIEFALTGDFDGYDRTIDVYIKNLRQKIETDPKNPAYIITVHGMGYKFGGEQD